MTGEINMDPSFRWDDEQNHSILRDSAKKEAASSGLFLLRQRVAYERSGTTRISTRRFWARPASVSLLAIG
jgi:hypothetical protein